MKPQIGATIVVESERAAQTARRGTIEEVLREDPPRFRVRWEDGKETLFSPEAGVARIEEAARTN